MEVAHHSIYSMNSGIDLVLPGISDATANEISSKVSKAAQHLELVLSCYHPQAEVYKLNQDAAFKPIKVSDELWYIISECIELNKKTFGYFNFGLKNLKTGDVINPQTSDFDLIQTIITNESHSIKFASKNLSLDFGAVGKGFVLREIAKILDSFNIENCLVSFGGSSFITKGKHPYGDYWPVSLRPDYNSDIFFKLCNHAASISCTHNGDDALYHIINPFTCKAVTDFKLVFIQGICPVVTEALSTAFAIMPLEMVNDVINFFEIEKAVIFSQNQKKELSIIYSHGEGD